MFSNQSSKTIYNCDGATVDFDFSFPITEEGDLVITLRNIIGSETVLTITTHYTVAKANNDFINGGTVSTVETYDSTYDLVIQRVVNKTQEMDLIPRGSLNANNVETAYDKLTMLVIQNSERIDRCLKVPVSDAGSVVVEFDSSIGRKNRYVKFDSEGNVDVLAVIDTTEIDISAFGESLIDDTDANEALETLGFTAFTKTLVDDTSASAFLTTLGFSTFVKTLIDDANAAAFLATLGFSAFVITLLNDADAAAFLTTLGFSTYFKTLIDASDKAAFLTQTGIDLDDIADGTFQKVNGDYVDANGRIDKVYEAGATKISFKAVEIGDWDMDATMFVTVAHGLSDHKKVRHISAIIRDDADTERTPVPSGRSNEAFFRQTGNGPIDATNVHIERIESGTFDNTDYDATSYNRGWIYLVYEN